MKKFLMIALAVLLVLSAAACGMQKIDTTSSNRTPTSQTSEPDESSGTSSELSSKPASQPESEPSSGETAPEEGEVAIFDPETQTTVSEVIEAEEDLDTALVNALNGALGLAEYPIKINSVTLDGGDLTIDLKEDSAPLVGVGSSGETACLKSIAVTFLKNYPEAEVVYFTVEGGIYSSGHIEFAPGEAYMDRSMME